MFGPTWEEGCPNCSLPDGPRRRRPAPPQPSRRHFHGHLAGPAGEARGVQAAHGLEVQLGLVGRHGLQLRLPRVAYARGDGRRRDVLQLRERPRSRPSTNCRASACSPRTRPATSSTPTRPTPAGSTPSSARTSILDLVPKGRDEDGLKHSMAWVRYHDRYDANYKVDPQAGYAPPKGACCQRRGSQGMTGRRCCAAKSGR